MIQYKATRHTVNYLLFAVISLFPINILLWYISNANGLGRSYFNIDYLAPVLLAAIFYKFSVSRFLFIIFYLLVYVIDISNAILVRFGFEENALTVMEDFGGIKLLGVVTSLYGGNILTELKQINFFTFSLSLFSVLLSFLFALYSMLIKKKRPSLVLFILISFYLLLTLLFSHHSVFLLSLEMFLFICFLLLFFREKVKFFSRKPDLLIFTIMVFYFMNLGVKTHTPQDTQRNFFSNFTTFLVFDFRVTEKDIQSADDIIFKSMANGKVSEYDNIFLIIVESLGQLKNEGAMHSIMNVFNDAELNENYNVEINKLKYQGHTTTAEFRELCKWQTIGLPNIANKGQFESCLPVTMKKHGFKTIGIHNGSRFVFDRNEWWPLFNFDEMHFLQDMTERFNYKDFCYAGKGFMEGFTAICEKDIMGKMIPEYISHSDKNFVYFLTIESHTPISADEPVKPEFRKLCDATPVLKDSKTICKIYDITDNLFLYTIDLAKRLSDKNNLFVIVGDHTPPFFNDDLVKAYDPDYVPTVVIESKKH